MTAMTELIVQPIPAAGPPPAGGVFMHRVISPLAYLVDFYWLSSSI